MQCGAGQLVLCNAVQCRAVCAVQYSGGDAFWTHDQFLFHYERSADIFKPFFLLHCWGKARCPKLRSYLRVTAPMNSLKMVIYLAYLFLSNKVMNLFEADIEMFSNIFCFTHVVVIDLEFSPISSRSFLPCHNSSLCSTWSNRTLCKRETKSKSKTCCATIMAKWAYVLTFSFGMAFIKKN